MAPPLATPLRLSFKSLPFVIRNWCEIVIYFSVKLLLVTGDSGIGKSMASEVIDIPLETSIKSKNCFNSNEFPSSKIKRQLYFLF